ncbi:efflux RND transporter periplasmic adaptor subunit [Neptuniibacter halophilus]|uniref:efflux RND transporter periplasmic adaptor subunit n=1 Tax=Neptuniibacter halophilus TaxID=651666 RepID=UPI00257450F6|nr:efflux RND transporter periplasmic adaptor subunit [Neptuniibacter halophilus]
MSFKVTTFLLCCTALLSGCDEAPSSPGKTKAKVHLVEVVTARKQPLTLERTQTGTLTAKQTLKLFNQEEGQIIQLPYHEGDVVKQGDLLVRIDGKLLQAQLERARAIRRKAEKDLQRVQELIRRKLVSQSELTQRETELAIAQADERLIATRLGYTSVFSPIDGVISQRLTEPGNIAEEYSHLLSISDLSALLIEVSVSELFLNQLRLNMPVAIQIDALANSGTSGDYPFHGKISRIHPVIDPGTRKGVVEITLEPIPSGARPGQFARVRFSVESRQSLLVPYASLRSQDGQTILYVRHPDGTVGIAEVSTGLRYADAIEVLSGLNEGQQVITRGFTNLRPGQSVQISGSGREKQE